LWVVHGASIMRRIESHVGRPPPTATRSGRAASRGGGDRQLLGTAGAGRLVRPWDRCIGHLSGKATCRRGPWPVGAGGTRAPTTLALPCPTPNALDLLSSPRRRR
jgi:hypothetical protein